MKILSLFDGMACGMLAMLGAGIEVDRYVAYEVDSYATKTSSHNFPMIEQRGDVFEADFTEFKGFDFVVGGSPCTYWSIAQTKNRETVASGFGWELFQQYVRAIKEAQPRFFIYENNKSMSKAIRASIDEAFGFEAIMINSALVSAQNRQRLYWVGVRQPDGSYKKAEIDQPEDRGIILKDILETTFKYLSDKEVDYMVRKEGRTDYGYIQRSYEDKAKCITANIHKGVPYNCMFENVDDFNAEPIPINTMNDEGEKARTMMAGYYKYGTATLITNEGFKGGTTAVAEPLNVTEEGKSIALKSQYQKDNISNFVIHADAYGYKSTGVAENVPECFVVREATKKGFTEIEAGDCVDLNMPNSKTRRGRNMKKKANCLQTSCGFYQYCGSIKYPIYEVRDNKIIVNGKEYPIKLIDGYYIIRKMTVTECKRLQTVPDWYEFPVSDSQAYKMLGNGWTVEVIIHLINGVKQYFDEEIKCTEIEESEEIDFDDLFDSIMEEINGNL